MNKFMKLKKNFKIENKVLGEDKPVYIIAEMSANHGNDLQRAIDIIHAAKESGADAIKLQTYTADTLTLNHKSDFFFIKDGPWKNQYMYELYQDASTPWEWHETLQVEAKKIGLTLFSSPFDPTSVEFLEELSIPAYKIASPEIIDLPLIRKVAQTGKPIIISTGGATLAQINEALIAATNEGATEIALLKCTSTYPAPANSINLKTIPHMRKAFGCSVGLSDHTMGIGVPIASVAFGTSIIEKHFILNREDKTADSFFSATPDEFNEMVKGIKVASEAIGEVSYPLYPKKPEKSIIVIKDIKQGELLNDENIKILRPGGGLEPKEIERILNHRALIDIEKGTPVKWNMVGTL